MADPESEMNEAVKEGKQIAAILGVDEPLCDCTCDICTENVTDPEDLCWFDCCGECECAVSRP